MKRSAPLIRRAPLKAHTPLARRAGVRKVNPKRKAERFAAAYHSEAFCAWVRGLGCVVDGCRSDKIHVAHVRSRGAGGRWSDTVALCVDHHDTLHRVGIRSFEQATGLDLADLAAVTAMRWRQYSQTEG